MFEKIKNLFKKETFACIVWDGKVIKYWDLTPDFRIFFKQTP